MAAAFRNPRPNKRPMTEAQRLAQIREQLERQAAKRQAK